MAVRTFDDANTLQRGLRRLGASAPGSWLFRRTLHHLDRVAHRFAPHRVVPSEWLAGIPVGMLTTTGARSGRPRTVPLLAVPLEDGWGVIASCFGQERPPAWYFNLQAHPEATLEVDDVTHRVVATRVDGADRERICAASLRIYPGYTTYEQRAGGRDLGFFLLRPSPTGAETDGPRA